MPSILFKILPQYKRLQLKVKNYRCQGRGIARQEDRAAHTPAMGFGDTGEGSTKDENTAILSTKNKCILNVLLHTQTTLTLNSLFDHKKQKSAYPIT